MFYLLRNLILLTAIMMLQGCASYDNESQCFTSMPIYETLKSSDAGIPLTQFEENMDSPMSVAAVKLFDKLIKPENRNDYLVVASTIGYTTGSKEVKTWAYDFISISEKYNKPSLHVVYNTSPEHMTVELGHRQLAAISGTRQKTDLKLINKQFSDSTATFTTKEYGPRLEFVNRAINGTGNISALVRLTDSFDNRQFTQEEMIARIQNLNHDDFFPKSVKRFRLNKELQDLNLEYSIAFFNSSNDEIPCENCRKVCDAVGSSCHVQVKFDRDINDITYELKKSLSSKPIRLQSGSVSADVPVSTCFDAKYIAPGECFYFTFTDHKGCQVDSHRICPNPYEIKSNVDDVVIRAELIGEDFYKITALNCDEDMQMESCSHDEFIRGTLTNFGKTPLLFDPAVKGQVGGVAELKFFRESGEYLKLSLPWGSEIKRQAQLLANVQKK